MRTRTRAHTHALTKAWMNCKSMCSCSTAKHKHQSCRISISWAHTGSPHSLIVSRGRGGGNCQRICCAESFAGEPQQAVQFVPDTAIVTWANGSAAAARRGMGSVSQFFGASWPATENARSDRPAHGTSGGWWCVSRSGGAGGWGRLSATIWKLGDGRGRFVCSAGKTNSSATR